MSKKKKQKKECQTTKLQKVVFNNFFVQLEELEQLIQESKKQIALGVA